MAAYCILHTPYQHVDFDNIWSHQRANSAILVLFLLKLIIISAIINKLGDLFPMRRVCVSQVPGKYFAHERFGIDRSDLGSLGSRIPNDQTKKKKERGSVIKTQNADITFKVCFSHRPQMSVTDSSNYRKWHYNSIHHLLIVAFCSNG